MQLTASEFQQIASNQGVFVIDIRTEPEFNTGHMAGFVHAQIGRTQVSLAEHKIVMQLTSSDPQVWKSLIKQLNNLKNGWKDSAMIEVVCHGPGLDFLTMEKSTVSNDISALFQRGVSFVACENTMCERSLSRESILPNTSFVLMGIAEIVVKQEQGWAYIKVGF